MASAVRVKNFKRLRDAAGGDENLAVALEVTLQRVRELAEGVNFIDETTHHIETVLGLKSGFLDQVNPVLTANDEQRLRTGPVGEPEARAAERGSSEGAAASAKARPAQEAQAKEQASGAPPLGSGPTPSALSSDEDVPGEEAGLANFPNDISRKASSMTMNNAPSTEPAAQAMVSEVGGGQSALPGDALREIRRANLAVLTNRSGAKSQLAALTQMSPANISHRLHGNKQFDQETADFFCAKLGLPAGWLDTPRREAEVPAHVHELLQSQSSGAVKGAPRKARTTKSAEGISATLALPAAALPAAPVAKALSLAGALPPSSGAAPLEAHAVAEASPRVPTRPTPARPVAPPAAAVAPAAVAPPAPAVVATSVTAPLLEGSPALGPIAEALVKTLVLKAKAGRISEEAALRMLTEVSLL